MALCRLRFHDEFVGAGGGSRRPDGAEGHLFDGNKENIAFIRDGNIQVAAIGYPLDWAGWAAIDQINRELQDKPLAKDDIRFKLITKDNLPKGDTYIGDYDFETKYRELWGLN